MIKPILRITSIAALFIFSACNSTQNSTEENQVIIAEPLEEINPEISEAAVKAEMEFLTSDELMGRDTGSEGIEKAANYIEAILSKNNVKPYFSTYKDSFQVNGAAAYNVVGVLEGSDPTLKNEFIIISGHYDHIGIVQSIDGDSIANGANDDAAGSVAVLELAKYFGNLKKNKRSILFAFFSAEEKGLLGSKHLASKLKQQNLDLYLNFNIEMIGVPMVGKDYQAYLTGYELSNFADKFNEYSNSNVLGFLPKAKEFNLFMRSDNYSIYNEFKVPAQTISSFDFTNYNYYHHVSDEVSEMDIPFMTDLIESMIPGVYNIVNTQAKEIKLN